MMASDFTLDLSPPIHREMGTTLDRSLFHKTLNVLAAKFPAKKVGTAKQAQELKRSVLDLPKLRSITVDPDTPENRLLLLRAENPDDILQAVLPEELCDGAPVGFSTTGHLAHLNLMDEYLPYKHLIGQLILDKNKKLTTVVNKLNQIDNQFRFFKMELIAGTPDYLVEHHESDCRFIFDFTKVYWNSRLHTEHERMVQKFEPEDVIVDVMAGVGPFAIPAAKKGCGLLANDLNPESHKYLCQNIVANKVSNLVQPFCEDGRTFIPRSVQLLAKKPLPPYGGPPITRAQERRLKQQGKPLGGSSPKFPPRKRISHFVMNLPDSALTFLDAYRGILSQSDEIAELYREQLPMVHCYCFTREAEPAAAEADIRRRAEEVLGGPLDEDVSFFHVRAVAPNKEMYCISFRLPREIAYASG